MRVFVILSCAVMMANAGFRIQNFRRPRTRKMKIMTYGPDVVRNGTCPSIPSVPCRGKRACKKDNHCEESTKKCCPVTCGSLCLDAVPGERRPGECPEFWNIPVEKYPKNDCDIDAGCPKNSHKCCPTEIPGIRKCVLPKA